MTQPTTDLEGSVSQDKVKVRERSIQRCIRLHTFFKKCKFCFSFGHILFPFGDQGGVFI